MPDKHPCVGCEKIRAIPAGMHDLCKACFLKSNPEIVQAHPDKPHAAHIIERIKRIKTMLEDAGRLFASDLLDAEFLIQRQRKDTSLSQYEIKDFVYNVKLGQITCIPGTGSLHEESAPAPLEEPTTERPAPEKPATAPLKEPTTEKPVPPSPKEPASEKPIASPPGGPVLVR